MRLFICHLPQSLSAAHANGWRRLAELRQVLELTDTLASLAEAQGAKPALGLRSALQQLCKASLDAMHTRALGKLTSGCFQQQASTSAVLIFHPGWQICLFSGTLLAHARH